MKILHISKYYYPFRGGTEQIAQDCVKVLKDNFDQKVICFNDAKNDVTEQIDGVEVIKCGCFTKLFSQSLSSSYKRKLKEVIDSFKPDIIVFHYPNPFVAALLLRMIPKETKLYVYWHLDIVKQKILGKVFAGQNRKLIERADKLIATSPNYVKGSPWLSMGKDKCVVIPNCINETRFQMSEEAEIVAQKIKNDNENKVVCLAVGRHTEYKGFKYLIEASKLLDDKYQFYFIGKGELTKELKEQAKGDEKIHFLGAVSDCELKAYLYAADIYCFPSITKNEAFGVALAEGMYFEKPAITFTIPGSGVNYVNLNNVTGIECPNRDSKAFADAIKTLSENKELREKYGKAAKQRVVDNFLYETFKDNIKKLFTEETNN